MSQIEDPADFQMENPFTFDYYLRQLSFYGDIQPTSSDRIKISLTNYQGPINDYFNANWYQLANIPKLQIGSRTWMSITPMEVQSMYLALYLANYDVVTAGLGLGYFALAAAAKPEVNTVTIYESETEVISWFKEQFQNRPEIKKISIIQNDFIEALRNDQIDSEAFIFNDIYAAVNTPAALKHFEEFQPKYSQYNFWGMESLILDALNFGLTTHVPPFYTQLFRMWSATPMEATGDGGKPPKYQVDRLYKLYTPKWTEEECKSFLEIWFI